MPLAVRDQISYFSTMKCALRLVETDYCVVSISIKSHNFCRYNCNISFSLFESANQIDVFKTKL